MTRPTLLLAFSLAACAGEIGAVDAGARDAPTSDVATDAPAMDSPTNRDSGAEPPLVRSTDFAEAAGDVRNPDRGFYWWDWNEDAPLVLVKVQLGAYCDTATLPAALTDAVRVRLQGHRDGGRRAIVRFLYADDGVVNGCGLADATSIDIVEGHVAQLAPLLAEFEDVIAYVEAGFFGMWGEWNSEHAPAGTSLWESQENRRRLLRALLDAVPVRRTIHVRRPRFRDELTFPAADLARIGFHDDCFLASATDYGTYDGARSVAEWKAYIRDVTQAAAIGGETCNDDPTFTACPAALAEMESLRWGYLHEGYSPAVIDRWRAEGCLEEIRARLGYRVVLRAVEAPAEVSAGGVLRVRLELENVGFAPPYSTYRARVVLRSATQSVTLVPRDPIDTRSWTTGAPILVELVSDLPADLGAGEWEVRLALLEDASDASAYALLLANDDRVRDDARRENVVAHVTVVP